MAEPAAATQAASPSCAGPPAGAPLLRLEGVRKAYGGGRQAENEVLHGIDLVLRRGEFVAMIGPSGSGKSTLLNLIGLLDRPTSGRLVIDGRDTGSLDEAGLTRLRGHTIGFVFQYHHLITAFTALENVMMPMLLARGRPDAAMRARAARLLDEVGLADLHDRNVARLSGGQQQRVAIARALALEPSLILADEPTGNLDTQSTQSVFRLMQDLNVRKGTTFLLVTHNLPIARRCGRVLTLVDGRIVADGPPGADTGADTTPGAA